jgi:hypothetical protein
MWKIFNYFSQDFQEERAAEITSVLAPINTYLSRAIIIYFMSNVFEYKNNDYPDWWDEERDIKVVEKFLKKYKFNFFDSKFDFNKLVKCVKDESS